MKYILALLLFVTVTPGPTKTATPAPPLTPRVYLPLVVDARWLYQPGTATPYPLDGAAPCYACPKPGITPPPTRTPRPYP